MRLFGPYACLAIEENSRVAAWYLITRVSYLSYEEN